MKKNFTFFQRQRLQGWLALFVFLLGTAGAQGQNLIKNPGFEDGMTNWSNWGGTNEIISTNVRSGENALSHTANGGFAQTVSDGIEVGKAYTLSVWCMTPEGMDGITTLGIQFKDVENNVIQTVSSDENIVSTDNFQEFTFKFTVVEGSVKVVAYYYQGGGTASIIVDDFSLTLDVEEAEPVLLGTGFDFKPSFVNVTGGGPMPDTTDGVIAICDGSGATDVTDALQMFLDSAEAEGKPLLIPASDGFYKISERLFVNTSVMGIGGMPTIRQTGKRIETESNGKYQGLCLEADMTGWIYNLHLVGTYDGIDHNAQEDGEYAYNISLRAVNGVTIMNNILETPQGDHIANDGSPGGRIRNVLITNNNLINAWRCGISASNIADGWAIMNNYMIYHSQYVNPIDLEPHSETSLITNFEVGYNDIYAPEEAYTSDNHYYDCVLKVTGWFDQTPGGNVFSHHNWGEWGVQWTKQAGYQGAESAWYNVEDLNNVEGDTIPASNPSLPTVPTDLSSISNSKTALTLSWSASTADAGLIGYLVYQDGSLLGITADTTYEVTGLACGNGYRMTVKAYDIDGNTSDLSAGLFATPVDCSGGINLLVNQGFEIDLSTGWDQDLGNAVRDTAAARSGMYGLKVGGAGDGGRGQMIDLTPDSSYTLIVWAKMVGTGLDAIKSYAGVEFKDIGGAMISAPEVVFTDTSDWKQYYLSFTVPSNAASIQVFTFLEATGTSNVVYADDYALVAAVPVSGLTLTPETASVPLGLVEQLKATIEPSNAINQQLTWSSSDTAVVKVSSSGLVKAMKEGSAIINVVSDEGAILKNCVVTVGPRTNNLILNPGIEEDLSVGWKSDWGGTSEVSTEKYHSGTKSLVIGPGKGGRAQTIPAMVPGGTYTLSAWSLIDGTNIDLKTHSIGMMIKDALGQRILFASSSVTDSVEFSQVSCTFTLPLETASTDVYTYQGGLGGEDNKLLTDDWGLVSGWEPLPFNISSDASISVIFILPGALSPAFSPDVEFYTTTVPEGTTSVSVRASASDPGAILTGDGTIDVSSGSATVEIEVTAEDGITTQTYTIEITVESSVGIGEKKAGHVSLYPNPVLAGMIFHLEGVRGGESISILDVTGRVVFTQKLQGSDHEAIQLSDRINPGSYIIKVNGKFGVYTLLLAID